MINSLLGIAKRPSNYNKFRRYSGHKKGVANGWSPVSKTFVSLWLRTPANYLGGVDKFEPVPCGSDVDHAEEALGELVIAGGDGAVDFQAAEEAFDMVSLFIERAVKFDLHAAV